MNEQFQMHAKLGKKRQGARSIANTKEMENVSFLCKGTVILSKDH